MMNFGSQRFGAEATKHKLPCAFAFGELDHITKYTRVSNDSENVIIKTIVGTSACHQLLVCFPVVVCFSGV